MANAGAVFRKGEVVDRPAPPHAPALHACLRALREQGFDAAPVPVRLTSDGREQLSFVPGEVALPPFPGWVMTDAALRSVGRLLRRLHDAGSTVPLDTTSGAGWPTDLADPEGTEGAEGAEGAEGSDGPEAGTVLCHNDICPENVVFRDGRAAALIDFDLAAPGRPLWDVAMTARYWVPMADLASTAPFYPAGLDAPARLRVLADGYGLSARERSELPAVVEQATEVCRAFVTARVAGGDPVYVRALAERGGWARWDRMQAWLAAGRDAFTAALLE
ncbi:MULTISPECIES: phosphotransferase enzyme family protein [Streptomyces]|uniref:Phosphotransferase enzyme family protein n=2 Tax=Streptomyces TaxID=1883 RepID=A0ABV9IXI1_9ACTN